MRETSSFLYGDANMNLGKTIKTVRTRLGLTQRALAARVGITPTYLCLVENGRREPGAALVRSICSALGVPPEIIFWEALDLPSEVSSAEKRILRLAKRIVRNYLDASVRGAPGGVQGRS
jgi:transcriptional regulator with XRE-family HTH domain